MRLMPPETRYLSRCLVYQVQTKDKNVHNDKLEAACLDKLYDIILEVTHNIYGTIMPEWLKIRHNTYQS